MKVCEIFSSLQGEGKYTGYPTTFIRLAGCPFSCSFCDTEYSKKEGKKMSIDRIMSQVNKLNNRHICITGGEPLMQEETLSLVYELLSFSYNVSIETSGLVPIEKCGYSRTYNYCMDLKCPCSGMSDKNCFDNLKELRETDELKCVVKDLKDIDYISKVLKKYPTKAQIILSPLDNDFEVCNLIIDVLKAGKIKGRLGIQLHKILKIA